MTLHAKDQRHCVSVDVNGRRCEGMATPRTLLADFLRHELDFKGVHVGCEHAVCGACTILLDGLPARACTVYALQVDGASIETVEGLGEADALSPLQAAFQKHHALQCGFCTPGILMSAKAFLAECPTPDEQAVRNMLSGHLCRCTGYDGIVRAILDCAAANVGDDQRQGSTE